MTTITLTAPAISCGHCVKTIQNEVRELAGVTSVQANQDTKQVQVTFEAPATQAQIEKLLAEIGYPAEKLLTL